MEVQARSLFPAFNTKRVRRLMGILVFLIIAPSSHATDLSQLQNMRFKRLSTKDGLAQNTLTAILQDRVGFIWIGTRDGLSRYDGYTFRTWRKEDQPNSLPDNDITSLELDRAGRLWIGAMAGGIARFDPVRETFKVYVPGPEEDKTSLINASVFQIQEAADGMIWVATERGLCRLNPDTNQWTRFTHDPNDPQSIAGLQVWTVYVTDSGVWAGTIGGVSHYNPKTNAFTNYHHDPDNPNSLIANDISAFLDAGNGQLWVAASGHVGQLDPATGTFQLLESEHLKGSFVHDMIQDHDGFLWLATVEGLIIIDPKTGQSVVNTYAPNDARSLSQNYVMCVFEDRSGVVWAGTFGGGLCVYNRFSETFRHYRIDPNQPSGFTINTIMGIEQGSNDTVWLASYMGGLVNFDPAKQTFTAHTHNPENPKSIADDCVTSLTRAPGGELWMSTDKGFSRYNETTQTFTNYLKEEDTPTVGNFVLPVAHDKVWGATFGKGLNLIHPQTGLVKRYLHDPKDPNSVSDSDLLCLRTDQQGRLWIGTSTRGLDRMREDESFQRYGFDRNDPHAVPHPSVLTIYNDPRGRLWLGTMGGGLTLYRQQTDDFISYNTSHGLVNDKVYGLVSGPRGFLWVATNRGLSRFEPHSETFKNFDTTHNLQGDEFGRGAAFASPDGNIYMGGLNGFNVFNTRAITEDLFKPEVTFTSFKKYNTETHLPIAIAYNPHITLNHDEVFLSLQFSALDFKAPNKNLYAYQMKGLDDTWFALGNTTELSFSNLDPGAYQLNLKATNHEGIWNETPTSLSITVLPPWWRTWPAYLAYLLMVTAMIMALIRYWNHKLAREQAVNQQLREVDRLKDEFLANTSHELKTPLHGLVGIAESLLEGAAGEISAEMADNLHLMVVGGRRLEHLVNDILDFSKMKHHDLELQLKPIDLKCLTHVVCTLCKPMADDKGLELINAVPQNLPPIQADESRLQQILYNLIGNAVKFTASGHVKVEAEVRDDMMAVSVKDTGIGFDPVHTERLFQSFEQADGSTAREYGGTGLGLAITRGIVQKHGGSITATATPGQGAQFTFTIPLSTASIATPAPASTPRKTTQNPRPLSPVNPTVAPVTPTETRFHILAVDDEPANRRVLANFLSLHQYQVTLAANGEEALNHLVGTKFDLILLDVMMPRMSGYEVCSKLRRDFSLHELPILFLTAKSQIADMVTGFNLGANDYITKPFSKDELLSRVRVHLDLVDINRNLEQKVAERTTTLRAYTEELEVLDNIVRNINREVEPQGLFNTILDQCMLLFPRAASGTFLHWDEDIHQFRFVAVKGYNIPGFLNIKLDYDEALHRYTVYPKEIGSGIYVDKNFSASDLPELGPGHSKPKSLVAVGISLDNQKTAAFLILDYKDDPDQLADTEIMRLQRFREHVVTALNRARMLTKLERHQRDLVEAAHLVGMAENATMVLHHMGNGLNSVNISIQVLQDLLKSESCAPFFNRIIQMLSNQDDMAQYLTRDPDGKNLCKALQGIANKLQHREDTLEQEVKRAEIFVQDLLRVLREQREYTRLKGAPETIDLNGLIKGCIDTGLRTDKPIDIVQHYGDIPPIHAPKIKVIRLISFLLQKAGEAVLLNPNVEDGRITVTTTFSDGLARVRIVDNGIGIDPKELPHIFSPAHHTEGDYMGFGLHNCANDIKEMGGCIQLYSDGSGQGSKVELSFPTA